MPTARATPNIALIKYWGNRDNTLRLCAADSISMTLDGPTVDVTVEEADAFSLRSREKEMKEKDIARFKNTLALIERYLSAIHPENRATLPNFSTLAIAIQSNIPPGIGLASSAAVFAAHAKAIAALVDMKLTNTEISVMARLGSGSAARSIFGGFGAIRNLPGNAIGDCVGWQVRDEHHWHLHDVIIVPSAEEKKVGSTEGHAMAHSSPHFGERIRAIQERRQQECIDAIIARDFAKLQHIAEEDCMDMHRVMQTQDPPLNYLSKETYRIIEEVEHLRDSDHLEVLYTMDAGPTVHLFCTDDSLKNVLEFAHSKKGCQILDTSIGAGVHLV